MNDHSDLTAKIRRITRVALPSDDGYLFRLGVALYGFAYVNSFMVEIITHLNPAKNQTPLLGLTSGLVLKEFRSATDNWSGSDISAAAARAGDEFERLNEERTDFVHSYPITNGDGEQILHRRMDDKGKYFEVTNAFLDGFISRLTRVTDALYEIRKIVKSGL